MNRLLDASCGRDPLVRFLWGKGESVTKRSRHNVRYSTRVHELVCLRPVHIYFASSKQFASVDLPVAFTTDNLWPGWQRIRPIFILACTSSSPRSSCPDFNPVEPFKSLAIKSYSPAVTFTVCFSVFFFTAFLRFGPTFVDFFFATAFLFFLDFSITCSD